ncbi:MAG: hypothetical protein R3F43_31830 [bacterium]
MTDLGTPIPPAVSGGARRAGARSRWAQRAGDAGVARPVRGLDDEPLAVEGAFSAVNPAIFSLDIAPWWPTAAGMRA